MLKRPKHPTKLLWVPLSGLFAATGNSQNLTKECDSLLWYMLGYAQRAIKSVVEREEQGFTSVSLDMVEHLGNWTTLGKLTQTGTNVGRKREVINIGHWGNRVSNHIHSVA